MQALVKTDFFEAGPKGPRPVGFRTPLVVALFVLSMRRRCGQRQTGNVVLNPTGRALLGPLRRSQSSRFTSSMAPQEPDWARDGVSCGRKVEDFVILMNAVSHQQVMYDSFSKPGVAGGLDDVNDQWAQCSPELGLTVVVWVRVTSETYLDPCKVTVRMASVNKSVRPHCVATWLHEVPLRLVILRDKETRRQKKR